MARVPRAHRLLTTSVPPPPSTQRQLSIAFESRVLQDMDLSERSNVVAQLAILLLQAAGVQAAGGDDDEL